MILVSLIDALKVELEELFKNHDYETRVKETKNPSILTGWYTTKSRNNDEEFPYVLISPVEQDDSGDNSTVELLIVFAAHSMDHEGWKDSALMAEKVRRYLETQHTIDKRYEVNHDIKIIFPDEQPYPQWFCWMHVKFNVYKSSLEEVYYD